MTDVHTKRLTAADRDVARALFALMAEVFEVPGEPLGDAYLERLLTRPDFWAIAAFAGGEIVGGVTAHTLPMTRARQSGRRSNLTNRPLGGTPPGGASRWWRHHQRFTWWRHYRRFTWRKLHVVAPDTFIDGTA